MYVLNCILTCTSMSRFNTWLSYLNQLIKKVLQIMAEEEILCNSNTYRNLTAEQWANYAQEIENELGLYKYIAIYNLFCTKKSVYVVRT